MLTADESSVTTLLATADQILDRANTAIGDLQGFVKDVRGPLTETIGNAERFTKSLADNADGVDKFLESVANMSDSINSASAKLDSTLEAADNLVRAVDAKKVETIVSNVEAMSNDLRNASGQVTDAVAGIKRTVETYEAFGKNAQETLKRVDTLVASVDPAKVGSAVDNVSAASADARAAVSSFQRLGETIDQRRPDIDKTIDQARDMIEKLNAASTRVDGILVKLDGFLGDADAPSLSAQARETMESFRTVANNINAQIGPIADNIKRFSGSGLRDVQALVDDTRRTMRTLQDTISNIDKDPQRLIFGGETVKQYDGRTRR